MEEKCGKGKDNLISLATIAMEMNKELRKTFAERYDQANNESDENCCILAVHITTCTIMKDHGAMRYNMDFVNKVETSE